MVDRLSEQCGRHLHDLWKIRLTRSQTSALVRWLASGEVSLGDILRDPDDRDERLEAVPLLVLRDGESVLGPPDEFALAIDDELLFAGQPTARRELETALVLDSAPEFVITGRQVPESWIWRRLTARPAAARR